MAETINVSGAVTVKVGTGSVGALEVLTTGGLRDGSTITIEERSSEVKTDRKGGEAGVPEDWQIFGEIARIRLELTRWDVTISPKIVARRLGKTAGTFLDADRGSLLVQGGFTFRVLLLATNFPLPMNFTRCKIENAVEINAGTKYSSFVITMLAIADDSGVLYNATTSG